MKMEKTTFDSTKLDIILIPIEPTDELVWEYVYNAESWNASYTNGGLKVYYEWADAASPYKEDLWNTVE